MPANPNVPFGAFNFTVDIVGVTNAGFSEVSGLGVEIGVIEYREGGDAVSSVRKLPGLAKYPNITLKRGLTSDHRLWDWMRQVIQGNVQRATIMITLLDDQRQPVVRWKVREAWIMKYEGPTLNAKGNEIAIESVEIAHEGIDLVALQ